MEPQGTGAATHETKQARRKRTPEEIVSRYQARIVKAQEPDLHRVPHGALERLEPCARKRARTVLRGGGGGNAVSLLGATNQLTLEQRSGANAYNTSYVYDPLGNRLQKFDSGALTSSQYNAANELIVVTPPSGAPTTSTFDANGNLSRDFNTPLSSVCYHGAKRAPSRACI